jgi:hypothetical protein
LSGAPGSTAITVASGNGLDVAEVGRKIPDEVFCMCVHQKNGEREEPKKKKDSFRSEALDEDAVKEGDGKPDLLAGSLGSLFVTWVKKDKMNECT